MTRSLSKLTVLVGATVLILSAVACKKPQLAPAPVKSTAPVAQAPAKRDDAEAKRRQAELDAARKAEEAKRLEAEKKAAFQKAAAAALQDIHFDYDKDHIKASDKERLQKIAAFMSAYPATKLQIQGHCDERGTNEYNLALGNRRAAATLSYLTTLGAKESQFSLISYGKERPLCTERTEACMAQNRRAHFELK